MGNKSKNSASPSPPKPRMAGDKNVSAVVEEPGVAASRALARIK